MNNPNNKLIPLALTLCCRALQRLDGSDKEPSTKTLKSYSEDDDMQDDLDDLALTEDYARFDADCADASPKSSPPPSPVHRRRTKRFSGSSSLPSSPSNAAVSKAPPPLTSTSLTLKTLKKTLHTIALYVLLLTVTASLITYQLPYTGTYAVRAVATTNFMAQNFNFVPPSRSAVLAYFASTSATPTVFDQAAFDEYFSSPNKLTPSGFLNTITVKVTSFQLPSSNYVVFKSNFVQDQAREELCSIALIAFIWLLAVRSFSDPLLAFVVTPLEKVSQLFKMLGHDPLEALNYDWSSSSSYGSHRCACCRGGCCRFPSCFVGRVPYSCWSPAAIEGLETTNLINSLLRLAQLLNVALGPAGTSLYKGLLVPSTPGGGGGGPAAAGALSKVKGSTVSAVFLFSDIRDFTATTLLLQSDVFGWINSIADLIHRTTAEYGGWAAKHVGDAFLVAWEVEKGTFVGDVRVGKGGRDEAEKVRERVPLRRPC